MPLDTSMNWTNRMAAADRYGNYANDPLESQARYDDYRTRRASTEALLRRLEPPDMQRQRQRVAQIEDTQDEDFDLEYRVPERNRFKRTEQARDAVAEQDRFFTQLPMHREVASIEALKERIKADAAIQREVERGQATRDVATTRGAADRDVAGTRGDAARDVAGITGGSRERQEATRQYGGTAREQVRAGDAAAGAAAQQQLQPRMGPPNKIATIGGPRGLQAYADEQGISLDQAIEFAEAAGFTVVD